jgi:hypothetical protein
MRFGDGDSPVDLTCKQHHTNRLCTPSRVTNSADLSRDTLVCWWSQYSQLHGVIVRKTPAVIPTCLSRWHDSRFRTSSFGHCSDANVSVSMAWFSVPYFFFWAFLDSVFQWRPSNNRMLMGTIAYKVKGHSNRRSRCRYVTTRNVDSWRRR